MNDDPDHQAHDRAVALLSPATVVAAARDLNARTAWDKRNSEHRWIMGRRASLLRRCLRDHLKA